MIHWWLELPLSQTMGVLALAFGFTAALIFVLTFHSPLSATIKNWGGLVAPYFGAISVLFALLTGFLAAEISDRNRQAARAVQSESEALTSMYALSIASASDMAPIRAGIRDYAQSVLNDEWPLIALGGSSIKTADALTHLMETIANPKIAADASAAVHTALVNLSLRVAGARADRLSIGADRTNDLKWLSVLFLCLMTQISLAMVHLERWRAHVLALGIFTVASVVALALIAEQESPFDGALQVSRTPLENVLHLAPAPNNPNG